MEVVYAYLPPSSSLPTKRSAPLTSDNNTKPDSFSTGKFRSPPNEIIPVFYPSSSLVIHIVTIALSKSAPSFLPSFQSRRERRETRDSFRDGGFVVSGLSSFVPSFFSCTISASLSSIPAFLRRSDAFWEGSVPHGIRTFFPEIPSGCISLTAGCSCPDPSPDLARSTFVRRIFRPRRRRDGESYKRVEEEGC